MEGIKRGERNGKKKKCERGEGEKKGEEKQ